SAVAAAVPGRGAADRRIARFGPPVPGPQPARALHLRRAMTIENTSPSPAPRARAAVRRLDPAVLTAFGCIVVLLLVGSLYSPIFLSFEYLLLQLKVGAFLGIIATGMMLVILL